MKVTAIIADDLVNSVKTYTRSSTITEAITIALKDWVDLYTILLYRTLQFGLNFSGMIFNFIQ